ncbi:MAG TPA: hypothetical protein VMW49_00280 [Candidatus Dormibacteraeota bacterium]|nr:hypothetical protein [Candidatus Dormibacteraeota bacterium]
MAGLTGLAGAIPGGPPPRTRPGGHVALPLRAGTRPPPAPIGADSTSQQCDGVLDPLCYIASAVITGPVALMGQLDGSPDPAHIDPRDGAITAGPWRFITTMVGSNPMVDRYDGGLGGPAHPCGPQGCIPWVQRFNQLVVPICLGLLVLVFAAQVTLFMLGQQLALRRHVLPCLLAAALLGANLPLHIAGRIIDTGTWLTSAVVAGALPHALRPNRLAGPATPVNLMTVLAITAYCPEDSPILHPGIHLSLPGPAPSQAVLVKPWMDPGFSQSHCIGSTNPDFVKEVLDRSDNVFGPPLHDANCDRGDASPGQPLCTNVDNSVNQNSNQDCLEGSGSSGGVTGQLGSLPRPGEPRAGDGQRPADCRYADIYWGTTPRFTDVWQGIGPHGRNGFDVPDGLGGMVAFTALTLLALVLAMTYLIRFLTLALLAAFSGVAALAIAIPGGQAFTVRYLRVLTGLSLVVVVQSVVFLVFVAVVSTVTGLAPGHGAGPCPLGAPGTGGCPVPASGVLTAVGTGDPGDQFVKCLFALLTVWMMLTLPRRLSPHDLTPGRATRALLLEAGGAVVASQALMRVGGPPVARFGRRLRAVTPGGAATAATQDRLTAAALEAAERGGQRPAWPSVTGREDRTTFVGRRLAEGAGDPREVGRRLGVDPPGLEALRRAAQATDASGRPTAAAHQARAALGAAYLRAQGAAVADLDLAYLQAIRRGRLRRDPTTTT